MNRPPRGADESIITPSRQAEILVQGALMTLAGLIIFVGAGRLFPVDSPEHVNTMLFTAMVLVQKIHAFNFLSEDHSIFSVRTFRNRWLNIAFVATVALQVGVIYLPAAESLFGTAPLGPHDWIAVIVAVLAPVVLIDQAKLAFTRRRRRMREQGVTS